MHEDKLRQVVEAMIFATDHALPINELMATLESVKEKDIRAAIERLNSEYEETGRSFMIREQAGGLRFVTRPDFHNHLRNLFKGRRKARLSRAALETLSIIAYKQPVSRAVIEAIRGVNIDGVVTTLLERSMITIAGRGDGPGRPLLYKTTKDFLEYFGLKNLGDLPNLREIKEIFQEGEVFKNLPDEVVLEPIDDDDEFEDSDITDGLTEESTEGATPDTAEPADGSEEDGTGSAEDAEGEDVSASEDESDTDVADDGAKDGINLADVDVAENNESDNSPADEPVNDSAPDDEAIENADGSATVEAGHDNGEKKPDDETGSGNPA